jgi:hypothetical protein
MKSTLKTTLMAIALTAAVSACDTKKEDAPLIEKQVPVIENGRMTPEILWAFWPGGQCGSFARRN